MSGKKGFTLVELMVVVLIVGILAAVALPLMSGRINSAKWSEGKAGAGTIVTSLRAYYAEKGAGAATPTLTLIGITNNDLEGTYFAAADYVITSASYSDTNGLTCVITVTSNTTTRAGAPTPTGTAKTLNVTNNVTNLTTSTIL